jgi:hypothetical protein
VTVLAKMNNRVVEIVKVAREVQFSTAPNWILICLDFEHVESRKSQFKWVPASTRFEWIRTFSF